MTAGFTSDFPADVKVALCLIIAPTKKVIDIFDETHTINIMKEKSYKIGHVEFGFSIHCRKWVFKITPRNHLLLACQGAVIAHQAGSYLAASVKRNLKKQGLEKVDGLCRAQLSNLGVS